MQKDSVTLLHEERPKLYTILAFLSANGLMHEQTKTAEESLTYNKGPK